MENKIETGYIYFKKGEYYTAALRFAEYILVQNPKHNIQDEFNPQILFDSLSLLSIITALKQEIAKTERILSIGRHWNDDEYLYVFTTIISYSLLANYFSAYGLKLDANLFNLYNLYKDGLENKKNVRAANIAKSIIKKNRKDLPEEWLRTILDKE